MNKYNPYMILYSKSPERVNIFNKVKKENIPNLGKFEAIDTINNWGEWCKYALSNNLTTKKYLHKIGGIYGKLGCNLSHQLLIQHVYEKKPDIKWLLIMEDDIELTNYSENLVNNLISKAEEEDSHYIQLFVNTNHKIHQSRANEVDTALKLYKMIPQWGTVCYLIDRIGMKAVIDNFPVETNMDYLYNKLIPDLNSLCYLSNTFETCGTMDSQDDSAELGSLIWNKPCKINNDTKKSTLEEIETSKAILAQMENEREIGRLIKFKHHLNSIEELYICPTYLYQLFELMFENITYENVKPLTKGDLELLASKVHNSNELNDIKFIVVNPYIYCLLQFMSVFERHFDKKTRQLTAKITFNGLFDHGNNRQQIDNIKYKSKIIFKPIKLDDLIQSQNQENITNVSLLDYAIKKINPIFPNIEQFYGQSSSFERGIVEKFFNMDFMIGNFKTGQYNLDLNNSNINPNTNSNKNTEPKPLPTKEIMSAKVPLKSPIDKGIELDNDPNNQIFQSLWIGDELSDMEKLSIQSFLDHGHVFHLYTYGEVKGVPPGTIVKDGNEILSKDEIFAYKNGSYSAFSNLFRFTMLYKKGGYWVDTDFVCLKPIYFDASYVIVTEPNENYTEQLPTSCFIKLPKGSKEAEEAIKIQYSHKKRILSGEISWSSGPATVGTIVNQFGLQKYFLNWDQICTCFCHHSLSLVNPEEKPRKEIMTSIDETKNMIGIHLWHECWRRHGLDKNGTYPENSIYQQLRNKYLHDEMEDVDTDHTLKIVFFVTRKTFLTKMARERFHGVNILMKRDNIQLVYSGIGWDNYDSKLSVHENLENIRKEYQWSEIDYIIGYKPLEIPDYKNIQYPKIIRYNEMYDIEWTLKEIIESGSDIVICHHLNDYKQYKEMALTKDDGKTPIKFYYDGHCVEKTIYKDWGYEKKYDILLAGCLADYHYPLRARFYKMLPKFKEAGFKVHLHPHPGYDLHDAFTNKYQIVFAKVINQSRICLTDTGIPRSRYGKYVEIPACKSVLAGDLPGDEDFEDYKADNFSDFVIEITMEMNDDEIIEKIRYYLENQDKYDEKIKNGLEFASRYTQEDYVDKLIAVLD